MIRLRPTNSWRRAFAWLAGATVLAGTAPGPAAAQRREPAAVLVSGLFGTGLIDREVGLTVGAGIGIGTEAYVARALVDLHLIQPDDSRYTWEVGSTGVECREESSGRVVDSSLCRVTRALAGVSSDIGAVIPAFRGAVHIGAGYRVGTGHTPYGLIGYAVQPTARRWSLLFRLVGGRGLLGLQAVATTPLGW